MNILPMASQRKMIKWMMPRAPHSSSRPSRIRTTLLQDRLRNPNFKHREAKYRCCLRACNHHRSSNSKTTKNTRNRPFKTAFLKIRPRLNVSKTCRPNSFWRCNDWPSHSTMKRTATSLSKVSRKAKKSWSRGCRFCRLVSTLSSWICKRKRRAHKTRHFCSYLTVRTKSFLKLSKWWPMFRTSIIYKRLIPETRQYFWSEKSMREKDRKLKRLFGSGSVILGFSKVFTSSHMIGF